MKRVSKLEYFFGKKVGKAIAEYNMIENNDRILVGVSGGKDSMSLLNVLRQKKRSLSISFDIIACYVDVGLNDNHTRLIESYLKENGYNYIIEQARVWDTVKGTDEKIECFWCAFNRRRKLFETADRLGCQKIAFGHHKDDIAETFLLNLFYHGEISTMVPNQSFFNNKFRIIRPLALCEEKYVAQYSKFIGFANLENTCPYSKNSKRAFIKSLLNEVAKNAPAVKKNIFRSLKNIKYDYLP